MQPPDPELPSKASLATRQVRWGPTRRQSVSPPQLGVPVVHRRLLQKRTCVSEAAGQEAPTGPGLSRCQRPWPPRVPGGPSDLATLRDTYGDFLRRSASGRHPLLEQQMRVESADADFRVSW